MKTFLTEQSCFPVACELCKSRGRWGWTRFTRESTSSDAARFILTLIDDVLVSDTSQRQFLGPFLIFEGGYFQVK